MDKQYLSNLKSVSAYFVVVYNVVRATLTLLSSSPNLPRASITRSTHAEYKFQYKNNPLFIYSKATFICIGIPSPSAILSFACPSPSLCLPKYRIHDLTVQNFEFRILALQNLEFRILDCQNPEFRILDHQNPEFRILAVQNLEFRILADQNPEFRILAVQNLGGPKSRIQDLGRPKL